MRGDPKMGGGGRGAMLSLIVDTWGGTHPGAWRDAGAPDDPAMDFERVRQMALTAERGRFHMLFLADNLGLQMEKDPELVALTSGAAKYEPFTVCSALAVATRRIGLAMTASTTYSEPFNLARMFASLDHLSRGRSCWNVVASTGEAAPHFNDWEVPHGERYERAAEYLDVVTALWDSWEDDAFVRDKAAGRFVDPAKMHAANHRGKHFQVEGPLNISRPIQGHPVIAQAGASPAGLDFATSVAEILFTLELDLGPARELYLEIKERAAAHGRDPDQVKVLTSVSPILGRSQAEAEEKLARLDSLADPRIGLERLKGFIDFDLSDHPLDGPVPEIPVTELGSRSMQDYYVNRARNEQLTVRELALLAMQFGTAAMSTEALIDHIAERLERGTCDGFNVNFPDAVGSLDLFVDEVVPELQRRGLFRTDYEGGTLREDLGLARPPNRFALDSPASP